MSGRGDGRYFHPDPDPTATIGLSLSASPSALSLSSKDPFYIVLDARILITPHPDKAITFDIRRTPLLSLYLKGFSRMTCTSDPNKHVPGFGYNHGNPRCDPDGLKKELVTVQPVGQGSYYQRHELWRSIIEQADFKVGETYRVSINNSGLGTWWWAYGTVDDFKGMRLRKWQDPSEESEEETLCYLCEREYERMQGWKEAPSNFGENPKKFAMIREVEAVEIDIVD